MRDIPFSMIQLSLYESLKRLHLFSFLTEDYSNGLNGSLSGAISGFLVTPMDVLKTR
jgi:hypothetical protein